MIFRGGVCKQSNYLFSDCFALPTVLIASIIMLSVLLSTLVTTVASRASLRDQFNNQQARLASEAGEVYASACLDRNNGVSSWANDKPLKPNTDCTGTNLSGVTCPGENDLCSISSNNGDKEKTTFSISIKESSLPNRWKKVSNGENYTCAISNEDKLYCWGYNYSGQLGDGTTINRQIPVAVNTDGVLKDKIIISVSTGVSHTCAITSETTNNAYCWGGGGNGRLGNGAQIESFVPVRIDFSGALGGKALTSISAGGGHTCAITNEPANNAYCWGKTGYGQLGNNNYSIQLSPGPVYRTTGSALDGKTVSSISAGVNHTCAITNEPNNNIYCWGDNYYGQLGDNTSMQKLIPTPIYRITGSALDGKTATSISAGVNHTCAITSEPANNVYCWGDNLYGQLGDNTSGSGAKKTIPTSVYRTTGSALDNKNVITISAGKDYTCVTTSESTNNTYCWGNNFAYQLGDNTSVNKTIPTSVYRTTNSALDGKTVTVTSAGVYHTCATTSESTNNIYCWGNNGRGQLGDNTHTGQPTPVAVNTTHLYVNDLDILGNMNLFRSDGGIWRQYNQSTRGNLSDHLIKYQIGFRVIKPGSWHTCAINDANYAYCWGSNFFGQIGDGTPIDRLTPALVNFDNKTVIDIDAGHEVACAITSEATNNAYCWGDNYHSQFGDGSESWNYQYTPLKPSGFSEISLSNVSVGGDYVCSLSNELVDNLYCWGENHTGQIGIGSTVSPQLTPVKPIGFSDKNVTRISSGVHGGPTCAITTEATNNLYCWGLNNYGQVGIGSTASPQATPVKPTGFSGKTVTAVSVGGFSYLCYY